MIAAEAAERKAALFEFQPPLAQHSTNCYNLSFLILASIKTEPCVLFTPPPQHISTRSHFFPILRSFSLSVHIELFHSCGQRNPKQEKPLQFPSVVCVFVCVCLKVLGGWAVTLPSSPVVCSGQLHGNLHYKETLD